MLVKEYTMGNLVVTDDNGFISIKGCNLNCLVNEKTYNSIVKRLDIVQSLYTKYYNLDGKFSYHFDYLSFEKDDLFLLLEFKFGYSVTNVLCISDNKILVNKEFTEDKYGDMLLTLEKLDNRCYENSFKLSKLSNIMRPFNRMTIKKRLNLSDENYILECIITLDNRGVCKLRQTENGIEVSSKYLNKLLYIREDDILGRIISQLSSVFVFREYYMKDDNIKLLNNEFIEYRDFKIKIFGNPSRFVIYTRDDTFINEFDKEYQVFYYLKDL